jgi:hypothetical protein
MNLYGASDLLEAAKSRFDETVLRNRMRGALSSIDDADSELLEIAESVVSRVQAAVTASIGWPLPGTSEDGVAFAEAWPADLLQRALDLFNWRTLSGLETVADQQLRIGMAAEKYFDMVQAGSVGLGLGVSVDLSPPSPLAARTRDGSSNIGTVSDRVNALDSLTGRGWDFA